MQGGNTQPELSDKLSDKLSDRRKKILRKILETPDITIPDLAKYIGISPTAISNNIAWLKENKYLVREGSDRQGRWIVLSGNDTPDQKP